MQIFKRHGARRWRRVLGTVYSTKRRGQGRAVGMVTGKHDLWRKNFRVSFVSPEEEKQ